MKSFISRSSSQFAKKVNPRASNTSVNNIQKRFLNIHEYQAKELFKQFDVPHQRGITVDNLKDVQGTLAALKQQTGTKNFIVKSQVLAGGRGKGHFLENGFQGGVKFTKDEKAAEEVASKMLHNTLVTKQTGEKGIKVNKIFFAECLDFKREFYFAILLDRAAQCPVFVASYEGGMDIEEVAEKKPEAIKTLLIRDLENGPSDAEAIQYAKDLQFKKPEEAAQVMKKLYKMFRKTDAAQLEINPLVELDNTADLSCVDCKLNIDDNAAFRQPEIFAMRDWDAEDPREVEAAKVELNYIGLDGNIGCLVNGAGLAMATMDIIQLNGGKPANFLDVGGGATTKQVKEAFKIILKDESVKCVLVNIFGGIMRCDIIADGIVQAASELGVNVPIVVRLAGTNVDKGLQILEDAAKKGTLKAITAKDLDEAAKKAVAQLK
ncbi:hypothetical protein FDP41_003564 [Naegleria fowleri]|uniref:Succinate--CoA ligase [ADP-forming] subunit beta, mitochondrial n=1 Tax=Naegleria fowleri TaxID=5763 RepID=A0A6A5BSA7_NAEFO|nr:uncharacterized protein FDP41_003564 [Naegleria fowleri]KAF0977572.1 hypothetical protein FDP41_003564 [Naegleria fowleri]CAG4714825.1 unnamed protein product [Naegleria fowleri]